MLRAYSTDLFRPALGRTKKRSRIYATFIVDGSVGTQLSFVFRFSNLLLASPISHLEMYNVWERSVGEGGGGGRWVSLASSRPPPPPLPPPGSQTLNMCGRQASGPIKTNNIYCKPVVCMFEMLLGWVSTATHIFLHDLCVGGASAHSLLLDLGLHCGLRSRPRQGPSIESIRDFVMGLLCCA